MTKNARNDSASLKPVFSQEVGYWKTLTQDLCLRCLRNQIELKAIGVYFGKIRTSTLKPHNSSFQNSEIPETLCQLNLYSCQQSTICRYFCKVGRAKNLPVPAHTWSWSIFQKEWSSLESWSWFRKEWPWLENFSHHSNTNARHAVHSRAVITTHQLVFARAGQSFTEHVELSDEQRSAKKAGTDQYWKLHVFSPSVSTAVQAHIHPSISPSKLFRKQNLMRWPRLRSRVGLGCLPHNLKNITAHTSLLQWKFINLCQQIIQKQNIIGHHQKQYPLLKDHHRILTKAIYLIIFDVKETYSYKAFRASWSENGLKTDKHPIIAPVNTWEALLRPQQTQPLAFWSGPCTCTRTVRYREISHITSNFLQCNCSPSNKMYCKSYFAFTSKLQCELKKDEVTFFHSDKTDSKCGYKPGRRCAIQTSGYPRSAEIHFHVLRKENERRNLGQ